MPPRYEGMLMTVMFQHVNIAALSTQKAEIFTVTKASRLEVVTSFIPLQLGNWSFGTMEAWTNN
jgi:hypothetical protein